MDTTVPQVLPTLNLTISDQGSLFQGQSGAVFTITVGNGGIVSGPPLGEMFVTLSSGLTATS